MVDLELNGVDAGNYYALPPQDTFCYKGATLMCLGTRHSEAEMVYFAFHPNNSRKKKLPGSTQLWQHDRNAH